MAERVWTVLDVIQWTTGYFRERGISEPRAAAEILLAHVLGVERIQLYLNFDQPLSPSELAAYRRCIKRRAAGEPVQYITGRQEFWSLSFKVTPAALIPRAETELLVEEGLRLLNSVEHPRVLEIGVGCGAVAVALARELEKGWIAATDISAPALALARENRNRLGVSQRVHLLRCNLLQAFRPRPLFHLIVSNPPYIAREEYPSLPREIREYEPREALWGGQDGLEVIGEIMRRSPALLVPGGYLLLEIGEGQGERVLELGRALGVYEELMVLRDYSGRQRVLRARKA